MNPAFASNDCKLTKAYKDARYDTYERIKAPYNKCKNTMKEAFYWKAVAECKMNSIKTNISCGQQVDNGSYATEDIDISHCETFKWKPEDIENYLKQRVESGDLIKCK